MKTEHLRFIDLSVALENDVPADPPGLRPRIHYTGHQRGAEQMAAMFPGLAPEQLPDGEGWAVEDLVLHTHAGTHMDAPLHYASTMNRGERAIGIDELPLDWCMAPGVKLDFRALSDGHVVQADEVEAELARIGHVLKPRDIVLVNTAAGNAYGTAAYVDSGCGMGRAATLYLLERGVRVVGTDAWSWDAPFRYTREAYLKSGDASIIWEGHKAGREIGYGQLEKLTNLDRLPPFGFTVCCFPYKIKGASAGFTRAVAIIDTESST